MKIRSLGARIVNRYFPVNLRQLCSSSSKKSSNNQSSAEKSSKSEDAVKLPDEPDNCCMSGCENCVWIQYAKELTNMYKDSGETAKKIILQKISDPSMVVFLKMELNSIDDKKSMFDQIQPKPVKKK